MLPVLIQDRRVVWGSINHVLDETTSAGQELNVKERFGKCHIQYRNYERGFEAYLSKFRNTSRGAASTRFVFRSFNRKDALGVASARSIDGLKQSKASSWKSRGYPCYKKPECSVRFQVLISESWRFQCFHRSTFNIHRSTFNIRRSTASRTLWSEA